MTMIAALLLMLRVFNPHETAVDATVECNGARRAIHVEALDAIDLSDCEMPSIDSPLPLTMFATHEEDGVETQRILGNYALTSATCEPFAVEAPLFGCRRGTAVVAVPHTPGAAYAWSVEGASVVTGHGTNRLVLTLGEGTSARVAATVTGACTASAQAVIALRSPLVIEKLDVPATATANTATTITWSYANKLSPASQLLSGEAFDVPIALAGDVRSYTWTPKTTGSKSIELRASYAPAISTKPPRRRRASGATRAIAADCPGARATGRVNVGGCGTINASIDAPEDIEAGATFTAEIFLRAGETVKWSVSNGKIISGGESDTVTVKAGDLPGELRLFATVTAGPSCSETAEARVAVREPAVCSTTAPSVALSVVSTGCKSAIVKATFTGTPPFRGIWSDGVSFETSSATLTHEFTAPTTYTIRNFRDATCSGSVSQTARVYAFGPSAVVAVVGQACYPGAKAVATLTGTPPFTGFWKWGEQFTTYEHTIETTDLDHGIAQIVSLRDAQCPEAYATSNAIEIEWRGEARLRERTFCTTDTGPLATMHVDVDFLTRVADPPFTVYWSDGHVSHGAPGQWTIERTVTSNVPEKTYSITRVAGPRCDALLQSGSTSSTITYRSSPRIDRVSSDIVSCAGTPAKIKLLPGFDPSAMLKWSVTTGEIVSGQGTPEITLANKIPPAEVTVEATYPDGRCTSADRVNTIVLRPGKIAEFSVSPATIPVGGTAQVHVVIDDQIENYSIEVVPASRSSAISLSNGVCVDLQGRNCTYPYRDKHGAGAVDLVLKAGNKCGTETQTVRLTIQ